MTLVRSISEKDKGAWLSLWAGYLEFYETVLPIEQTELTWTRLLDPSYNSFGLVAEIDKKIVGITHYSFQSSTWAKNNYCYLQDLYVDPRLRGKGLGRALIDAVQEIAVKEGSSRLYWNTDRTNETARKLYDRYGLESGKVQYRIALRPSDQN